MLYQPELFDSASRARPVGAWTFDPANATREMPFPCRYSTELQDIVALLPGPDPFRSAHRPCLRLGLGALPFTIPADRFGVDWTPVPPVSVHPPRFPRGFPCGQ